MSLAFLTSLTWLALEDAINLMQEIISYWYCIAYHQGSYAHIVPHDKLTKGTTSCMFPHTSFASELCFVPCTSVLNC